MAILLINLRAHETDDRQWSPKPHVGDPFPVAMRVGNHFQCGYIDSTGRLAVKLDYAYALDFSWGLARVRTLDGRDLLIDVHGRKAMDIDALEQRGLRLLAKNCFQNQTCRVADTDSGLEGIISVTGELVIPCRYITIFQAGEGLILALPMRKDQADGPEPSWEILDYAGKKLGSLPDIPTRDRLFHNGLVAVRKRVKEEVFCDYYDKAGTLYDSPAHRPQASLAPWNHHAFCSGLASANQTKDGPEGYITRDGTQHIPFVFDEAFCFYDGLAIVVWKGKYFYIDVDGQIAVPLVFTSTPAHFRDNVSYFPTSGSSQPWFRTYFNRLGEILWKAPTPPPQNDRIIPYKGWLDSLSEKDRKEWESIATTHVDTSPKDPPPEP